jgi:hypothetical protein
MAEKPSFSIIVLEQLRAAHYRPGAWVRMLSTSWIQPRTTAHAHPHLVQEWRRIAGILGTATLGFAVYTGKRHGRSAALKTVLGCFDDKPALVGPSAARAGRLYGVVMLYSRSHPLTTKFKATEESGVI